MTVLEAMAHREGFYDTKNSRNRPQRNNNPGDLSYGTEAIHFGAIANDKGYAIFPSVAIGWEALKRWLSVPAKFNKDGHLESGYLGATIEQVITRFAPPSENDTEGYINYVVQQTGLDRKTILTSDLLVTPL